MLWAEGLSRKSDVFGAFQRCKAAAENESGTHVRRLRSDNGGKYMSHDFHNFVAEHGIHHDMPSLYCPQANGVAERINRTLVEGLITLLNQAQAPNALWAEALLSFVFVKNRSPHAALAGGVPLTVWRGKPVRVAMLRVRGCRAYHMSPTVVQSSTTRPCLWSLSATMATRPPTASLTRRRARPFDFAMPDLSRTSSPSPPPRRVPTVQSLPQPAPAPDDLINLASSQAPSAANDATPQTPARAPPVVPRPPVRAAQAREVVVTPPPPPVFHRASAPSPPSPEPVLPDEESRGELDFLGNDPFGATLAELEALYSAAVGTSLPPTGQSRFRHPTLAITAKRCVNGLQALAPRRAQQVHHSSKGVQCLPPVDRSKVSPDTKSLVACFVY